MNTPTTEIDMAYIHELMRVEFGRLAEPLDEDSEKQVIRLSGGKYVTVVYMRDPSSLTVSKLVSNQVDFELPGIAAFLLREHGRFLFGRCERVGEMGLAVEHSIDTESLTSSQAARAVLAVHELAVNIEKTLEATGALTHEDID